MDIATMNTIKNTNEATVLLVNEKENKEEAQSKQKITNQIEYVPSKAVEIAEDSGIYTQSGTNKFSANNMNYNENKCTVENIVNYYKINHPNSKAIMADFMLYDNNSDVTTNKMWEDIDKKMEEVCVGKSSAEDIETIFSQTFDKLYKKNIEIGMFKDGDKEATKNLAEDLFQEFQKNNIWTACGHTAVTACAIAENYGGVHLIDGTPFDVDFLYYSADDYYASKDIEQGLKEEVSSICKKYNLKDIDTNIVEGNMPSVNKDYNSWYQSLCCDSRVSSMIDTNQAPPKGFTFFYQEQKYSKTAYENGKMYTIMASDGKQQYQRPIRVPAGCSLCNKNTRKSLLNYILDKNNYRQQVMNDKGQVTNCIDISDFVFGLSGDSDFESAFDQFCDNDFFNDQAAVAVIGYDGITKEITVPYNIYTDNRIDHYNLSQLVQADETETPNADVINSFLRNINVFEFQYGISYFKHLQ